MNIKKSITILFIFFCLIGCKKEIDYVVTTEWIYSNQSNQTIEVIGKYCFTIKQGESFTIKIVGEGPENVDPYKSVIPPIGLGTKLVIDGHEAILPKEITEINNYKVDVVAKRHFLYTYSFNEFDINME